jgi:hypothetical protein
VDTLEAIDLQHARATFLSRPDRFASLDWPNLLNRYARAVNPLMNTRLGRMNYYWVTAQCEYSTDVLFKARKDLQELYPRLISHSMQSFGAKEVIGFLGKKLVGQFRGEVVSNQTDRCKHRLPGTRIRHRAKMNGIKMYDKGGSGLRVETVINEPEAHTTTSPPLHRTVRHYTARKAITENLCD